jgi:hypothetical protein
MRAPAATLTALALLLVGAASAGAAPARTAKLTAAEQAWVKPVVALWNMMNGGLLVVGKETTATNALVPGTAANKTLIQTLGGFVTCTGVMKKAKVPPSARLQPFAQSMTLACASLGTGAHGVANGISTIYAKHNAKLASLQIKAAFGEFAKGSAKITAARRQLLAVGGKTIFSA